MFIYVLRTCRISKMIIVYLNCCDSFHLCWLIQRPLGLAFLAWSWIWTIRFRGNSILFPITGSTGRYMTLSKSSSSFSGEGSRGVTTKDWRSRAVSVTCAWTIVWLSERSIRSPSMLSRFGSVNFFFADARTRLYTLLLTNISSNSNSSSEVPVTNDALP